MPSGKLSLFSVLCSLFSGQTQQLFVHLHTCTPVVFIGASSKYLDSRFSSLPPPLHLQGAAASSATD